MRKMSLFLFWTVTLIFMTPLVMAETLLADQIMSRAIDALKRPHSVEKLEVKIGRLTTEEVAKIYVIDVYQRQTKKGDRLRINFVHPPGLKGTSLYVLDHPHRMDKGETYIHLPALGAPKKVVGRDLHGDFFGMDLTIQDLRSFKLNNYQFKLLKEERVKRDCYVIEAIPLWESQYAKKILYITKSNFFMVKIIFFDKGNVAQPSKTLIVDEIMIVEGRPRHKLLTIENIKKDHFTHMKTLSVDMKSIPPYDYLIPKASEK
jgi:hypothetical protein